MAIENAFGKSIFVFFFSKTILKNDSKLETKKGSFQNFKINFEKSENTDESSYRPMVGSIWPTTNYKMIIMPLKL